MVTLVEIGSYHDDPNGVENLERRLIGELRTLLFVMVSMASELKQIIKNT